MNIQEETDKLLDKLQNNALGLTKSETEFLQFLLLHILGIDHEEVVDRLQADADGKQDYWDWNFPSSVKRGYIGK